MMLGLSISAFTVVHVVISLVAIAAGAVVVWGMFAGNRLPGWTALFLATTVLTTVTGFMFPTTVFTPALGFGVISAFVLAATIPALYVFKLAGHWRWIYITGAIFAFYLNAFVAIVQAFLKVPFLMPLAPTQSELPFVIAQGALLVAFVAIGYFAVRSFKPMLKPAG